MINIKYEQENKRITKRRENILDQTPVQRQVQTLRSKGKNRKDRTKKAARNHREHSRDK